MTFQQAQAAIRKWTVRTIQPGLSRTKILLSLLDHPDRVYPKVHITGTNGKGSVTAFLSSMLTSAGYRVGRFTSPHLADERERIVVNQRLVEKRIFAKAVEKIIPGLKQLYRKKNPATLFEAWTVLATEVFRQAQVDVAIIEVGMGGRLDATTALEQRIVSILTNVQLEHTEQLGRTKKAICHEKLGITLPGVPLLTAEKDFKLRRMIRSWAKQHAIPLAFAGDLPQDDFRLVSLKKNRIGQTAEYLFNNKSYKNVRIPLAGNYQAQNAALALLAVDQLKLMGFSVTAKAWRTGLQATVWPGRMERVSHKPEILLDGAHNPAGVWAATQSWREGKQNIDLVIGMMQDKDVREICRILALIANRLYTVTPPEAGRGLKAEKLALEFSRYGKKARPVKTIHAALQMAVSEATPNKAILVIGSLYLIEPARQAVHALGLSV